MGLHKLLKVEKEHDQPQFFLKEDLPQEVGRETKRPFYYFCDISLKLPKVANRVPTVENRPGIETDEEEFSEESEESEDKEDQDSIFEDDMDQDSNFEERVEHGEDSNNHKSSITECFMDITPSKRSGFK